MKHIVVVVFLITGLIALGCGGGSGGGGSDDGDQTAQYEETSQLKEVTSQTENAFLDGDAEEVLKLMSEETKGTYQSALSDDQAQLVNFGNDFKNRKLIFATDNYAEYEFTANNQTYTVTFSLQEDGTWKLTRF